MRKHLSLDQLFYTKSRRLIAALLGLLILRGVGSNSLSANVVFQGGQQLDVTSVAWSPDGSKIAVGRGTDVCDRGNLSFYSIQILDSGTGQVVQNLSGRVMSI